MDKHVSVLLEEAVQTLVVDSAGTYVDCTFGRGGHSRAILKLLSQQGHLIAIDRDTDAVNSEAAAELSEDGRFCLHHAAFTELGLIVDQVDGVLIDLGVSSPQLDNPSRGFSFLKDGPLDMRMDKSQGITAAQWLAEVDEKDLVKVLFEYGEERFARRIANAVVMLRAEQTIDSTLQLAHLIEQAVPFKEKHKHPATRSFQAIRIFINGELEQLKQVLMQTLEVLKPGGRLVVISFHSLEDRLVKRFIRDHSKGKYSASRLPLRDDQIEQGKLVKIGKFGRAGKGELENNPRARSAVMRVAERR